MAVVQRLILLAAGALVLAGAAAPVQAQSSLALGAAQLPLAPRGSDAAPPAAPHRTEAMLRRAAPTSQWYSTIIFNERPLPIFVQPLTVRPTPAGLEFVLPVREVTRTERQDTEVAYPHKAPLLLSPADFEPGPSKLAGAGDWHIDISMARGGDDFSATVAHGSPYVFLRVSRGGLKLRLPAAGERYGDAADLRTLALRVNGRAYAVFLPAGGAWQQRSPTEWQATLPEGKGLATAAVLPDDTPATLALLARHAVSRITGTRVDWQYDAAASQVRTTFSFATAAAEGDDPGPLTALYPHHWHDNASVAGRLGPAYDTVRGPLKLLAARSFTTSYPYTGFVPMLPGVADEKGRAQLADVMKPDLRNARRLMLPEGQSAYWQGKGLQRVLKMADVLEQQGDAEGTQQLLAMVKKRMEEWLSGGDSKRYFFLDRRLGTVASHPNEFFAIEEVNDHHFWYGYWIRAAAEVALRDPAWAARERWGAMVETLVADIATAERGRADFPFLRNFDPYEGHSWANGLGGVGEYGMYGNNQESSSEAINAWAGLVLWGEVTGNRALRDLGAWMYATEWKAIEHYWFDVHKLVLAPEYRNVDVAQLFGGKYIHNTWWTDEPRQITGINLLPVTTASTAFARHPAYIRRNLDALKEEQAIWAGRGKKADPPDIWQDIYAKYRSMADPAEALAGWNRWGAVELGETRTATLHWLLSLNELGVPEPTVTADTPLYAVFRRADGTRTHLAWNAGRAPLQVKFSDGTALTVEPGKLARSR